MPSIDLLDVNVWLALSVADHSGHQRARQYWFEESANEIAFCRVTSLGFLRLSTQPKVMNGRPLAVAEAWLAYQAFQNLPEVVHLAEHATCEDGLRSWSLSESATPRLWTDAYLAAFARSTGARMISFDRDFTRMEDLDLLFLGE